MTLLKRCNFAGRLKSRSTLKRIQQFLLMNSRPFANENHRALWKRSLDYLKHLDRDLGNVFAVNRVKMGW